MRALFFGTPEIAVPSLKALAEIAEIPAVVCQPDRPAGRGMKLRPPPVKVAAEEMGIAVHQPKKVRNQAFTDWVRSHDADVALVIAYGRILPKRVLDGPKQGCMNLHASILPKLRGAAPINWAIVRGHRQTGVGLMQMDEGMDTGPVFHTRTIPIGPNETAGELADRIGALAAEVVRLDLAKAVTGETEAVSQDHDAATMAPMMSKEDGVVPWAQSAQRVHDHVRGFSPWPGAHGMLGDKRFKVLKTALGPEATTAVEAEPGTVVGLAKDHALVACGEGQVRLLRGQLAGKKALDAAQLVAGRTLAVGSRFTSPG